MKIKELTGEIEKFAPLCYQESYDNSGLIVGNQNDEVNKALLCIDCTEETVMEALKEKCDIIIAHHPILFSGIKKLNGSTYVERTIISAIKNNIAIYAAHTNMDNVYKGVNAKIAEKLNLKSASILQPKNSILRRLIVFCPIEHAEEVRNAMFKAGAGQIGEYDECSFSTEGTGTFRPGENADPFIGKAGKKEIVREVKIETIYPEYIEKQVLKALKEAHPYEEVAFDILNLYNEHQYIGSGLIGELEEEQEEVEFLKFIKTAMKTSCIRHTEMLGKPIKKVAVCGGSGSFLLGKAISAGADIFITGDFKYHQFFDAEGKILIADIGHFESEQFTTEIFYDIITKKFTKFAVCFSKNSKNPVNYLV